MRLPSDQRKNNFQGNVTFSHVPHISHYRLRCYTVAKKRIKYSRKAITIPVIVAILFVLWSLKDLSDDENDNSWNAIPKKVSTVEITDPILIFTCLGTLAMVKHQNYIWFSLKQARLINPNLDIVVVLHRSASNPTVQNKFLELNITSVIYEDLIPKSILAKKFHQYFFPTASVVPNGNHHFIRLTLERLFLLHAYLIMNERNHIFHMENDNMLYIDLRVLSRRFDECGISFGVPRASKDLAVISFTYFRQIQSLEQFLKWCIDVLRHGPEKAMKFMGTISINDMTLASRYLDLYTSSPEQSRKSGIYELPTQLINNWQHCCLCSLNQRPIIFDGCTLGQYFGGTYAHPNRSYWESNRLLDPRGLELTWKKSDHEIRVPYIKDRRIMNIHVHSKLLDKFSSVGNQQTIGFPLKRENEQ